MHTNDNTNAPEMSDVKAQNVTLFLGAGASSIAGYKTFQNFPDLIFDPALRAREGLPPVDKAVLKLLESVRDALERTRKPTTHDNFLWVLEGYNSLCDNLIGDLVLRNTFVDGTADWGRLALFSRIVKDAIREITLTTIQHYSKNRVELASKSNKSIYSGLQKTFNLYHGMARINDSNFPELCIFTTNYDMLLEDLHNEFAANLNPKASIFTGIKDVDTEGAPWVEEGFNANTVKSTVLRLYRIHGCVCWFYFAHGDENVYFHRRDCHEQDPRNLCAMYPGREIYRGMNPHALGFRQLYRSLLNCKCIVFVGFSFRDDDVMHLLLTANAEREFPLKLVIFDQTMRSTDVQHNLAMAAKGLPLPIRVPLIDDIAAINSSFGAMDFDTVLIDSINNVLNGGTTQ